MNTGETTKLNISPFQGAFGEAGKLKETHTEPATIKIGTEKNGAGKTARGKPLPGQVNIPEIHSGKIGAIEIPVIHEQFA